MERSWYNKCFSFFSLSLSKLLPSSSRTHKQSRRGSPLITVEARGRGKSTLPGSRRAWPRHRACHGACARHTMEPVLATVVVIVASAVCAAAAACCIAERRSDLHGGDLQHGSLRDGVAAFAAASVAAATCAIAAWPLLGGAAYVAFEQRARRRRPAAR